MMRRFAIWFLAGIASIALTALMFFPANWLATLVEMKTAGRLTLGDAQGTLWRGSAFIGAAPGGNDPVTPLLPGRFAWRISPTVLLGRVDAELKNVAALSQPIGITGGWQQWQVSPGTVILPAERLAALGSPLNTVQPSGQMRLSWQALQLTRLNGQLEITGSMNLAITDIASRLSPIKPLGSYDLALEWRETQATVTLKTITGPMLLNGAGVLNNGHLQFSGTARAAAGHEQKLANLLNLLGQRRMENGLDVIALEFK